MSELAPCRWTPRVIFYDGLLGFGRGRARYVVSAYPDSKAWFKPLNGTRWYECDKPFGLNRICRAASLVMDSTGQFLLPFPGAAREEAEAYQQYLRTIPREVRLAVLKYPPEGQWRLLLAFSRLGSVASDLARGGAWALLFLLGHLAPKQAYSPDREVGRRA
jgi:hypothetical protein